MKVILYTTRCPKCSVLEKKLNQANIEYEEFTDIDEMLKKGMTSVPMLGVNDEILDFTHAVAWIRDMEGK